MSITYKPEFNPDGTYTLNIDVKVLRNQTISLSFDNLIEKKIMDSSSKPITYYHQLIEDAEKQLLYYCKSEDAEKVQNDLEALYGSLLVYVSFQNHLGFMFGKLIQDYQK